jgi:hypothetical protein
MTDFLPVEKASPIREPSTANLMIDSTDGGPNSFSYDFQITKNQNILNGFFTRIGVSEVVLYWNVPNVYEDNSNNFITLDVSGASVRSDVVFSIPEAAYSVADALDTIADYFNSLPSATRNGATIAISAVGQSCYITMTNGSFGIPAFNAGKVLGKIFGISPGLATQKFTNISPVQPASQPTLLRYRYIDIVSQELTYNQELKDASTAPIDRNVLVRWYFSNTTDTPSYDKYGFLLVSGMKQMSVRRLYSPPKQIRWSPNQPIGNLSFQTYDDNGNLLEEPAFEFLMTLQVSEV